MRVIFQEVNVENIQKGKSRYSIATVTYTSNGRNMQQKLLSFANPDSFAAVQKLAPGQEIEVEVTKNDAGYNQWASVKPVAVDDAPAAVKATGGKAPVSQYETREERQVRQLHIVRQSSISSAIAALTPGAKAPLKPEDVIAFAQELVEFVYSDDTKENLAPPNTAFEDVPL